MKRDIREVEETEQEKDKDRQTRGTEQRKIDIPDGAQHEDGI